MKKSQIFIRTFCFCFVIGSILNILFGVISKSYVSIEISYIIIDLFSEILMDSIFGLFSMHVLQTDRKEVTIEQAKFFMNKYALRINDNDGIMVGEFSKYKQYFMGNIRYDKKSSILCAPRMYLKNHGW